LSTYLQFDEKIVLRIKSNFLHTYTNKTLNICAKVHLSIYSFKNYLSKTATKYDYFLQLFQDIFILWQNVLLF